SSYGISLHDGLSRYLVETGVSGWWWIGLGTAIPGQLFSLGGHYPYSPDGYVQCKPQCSTPRTVQARSPGSGAGRACRDFCAWHNHHRWSTYRHDRPVLVRRYAMGWGFWSI